MLTNAAQITARKEANEVASAAGKRQGKPPRAPRLTAKGMGLYDADDAYEAASFVLDPAMRIPVGAATPAAHAP